MADVLSNQLKAVFFPDDITTDAGSAVFQQDCLTVRNYSSAFSRTREGRYIAGGLTTGSKLSISVRIHSSQAGKFFYESLWRDKPQSFSVLFNARFNPDGSLREYEDAMVVCGYIVDVGSAFDSAGTGAEAGTQMCMDASVLVYNVTYLGKDTNRTLTVRQ